MALGLHLLQNENWVKCVSEMHYKIVHLAKTTLFTFIDKLIFEYSTNEVINNALLISPLCIP